jgi:prepilin-type N-terminal cleavage/methylation domain-containing protein
MQKNSKGYTLIELIVVIVLFGIIFSFTAPKFRDAVLTDSLKNVTRDLIGKINILRSDAILESKD